MATFKAVVLKHQERRDGKFPVSIRITQNRRSVYIPTGLYVSRHQINKKTFEIKDQFVLMRTGQTIQEYERKLLELDTETLRQMSGEELKRYMMHTSGGIDYLGYCHDLLAKEPKKWAHLKSALLIIEEMGIDKLMIRDFTSRFLNQYKQYMDNRKKPIMKCGKQVGEKVLGNRIKNTYLMELCKVFRQMQKEYNTEFEKVIAHDPLIGLEGYRVEVTKKRSISVEKLREFFALNAPTEQTQLAQDMMKMSFCLCGINLIDLLSLKRENYNEAENSISYQRQKTSTTRADGAWSRIRIEPEIEDLVKKYESEKGDLLFDFGMAASAGSTRNIGMSVARLCELTGFEHISPYWMRHTWATIARNDCDISKDDIDLCLNHVGQNKMADVYIKPDWSRIDRANRRVLDLVFGGATL